ncbi:hypothetical protein [Kribbella steppae]|uniref:hypothetical protein n=1 Tax=Kribbella steppae TaxID=2512223 RepID=UPI001046CFBC|nr:hypothetical protein [Kribbella steppae]
MSSSVAGTVSPTRQALRLVRRDRSARAGVVIVGLLILIAVAAPLPAVPERADRRAQ